MFDILYGLKCVCDAETTAALKINEYLSFYFQCEDCVIFYVIAKFINILMSQLIDNKFEKSNLKQNSFSNCFLICLWLGNTNSISS